MMSIEALKQMVEALKDFDYDKRMAAIKAGEQAIAEAEKQEPVACWCHKCNENKTVNGVPFAMTRMIVCPECGNKRCPKASDHTLQCTNSNEPNQAGSVYTHPQPRTWVGLMRGVRVEGDTVVISVKGGNDAARELCGELIEEMNK